MFTAPLVAALALALTAQAAITIDDDVHVFVADGMPSLCIPALPSAKKPPKKERDDVVAARLLIQADQRFQATSALRRLKPVPAVQAARAVSRLLDRDVLGASTLLDPLLRQFPDDGCLLRTGAMLAAMSDQRDVALDRASRAAAAQPDHAEAVVLHGILLAETDNATARTILRAATERFADDPMPALHLGSIALEAGDFDTGWWALSRAVERGMDGLGPQIAQMALQAGDRKRYLQMAVENNAPLGVVPEVAAADDPWAAYLAALGLQDGEQLTATFLTSMGDLSCTLLHESAPVTVANFVGLAIGKQPWEHPMGGDSSGPLYQDLVFHRVIPGFMVQSGDPMGDGRGGPGYRFADEIDPKRTFSRAGLLAMANAGPGTNGSQWFITDAPAAHLDGRHTIFGECSDETVPRVAAIARVPTGSDDRPTSAVTISRIVITSPSAGDLAVPAAADPADGE